MRDFFFFLQKQAICFFVLLCFYCKNSFIEKQNVKHLWCAIYFDEKELNYSNWRIFRLLLSDMAIQSDKCNNRIVFLCHERFTFSIYIKGTKQLCRKEGAWKFQTQFILELFLSKDNIALKDSYVYHEILSIITSNVKHYRLFSQVANWRHFGIKISSKTSFWHRNRRQITLACYLDY